MKRLGSSLLSIAILIAGMGWTFHQEGLLSQRIPSKAFDRYAIDTMLPTMPERITKDHLLVLCPNGPRKPSACVDRAPREIPGDAELTVVAKAFQFAIKEQIQAADAITSISVDHPAFADFRQIAAAYRKAGRSTLNAMSDFRINADIEQITAESEAPPLERLQTLVQRGNERTQRELRKIQLQLDAAGSRQAVWEATRSLGLLASGLRLSYDYGTQPPSPTLLPDRSLLAEQIEWLRRASRNAADSSVARTYPSALLGIALSGTVAVILAIALNTSPTLVALITVSLGTSWLMLVDIGLTGPTALRYLPILQFSPVWAHLGSRQLPFFLPLLCFGITLVALRLSWKAGAGWFWHPAETWVATGSALKTTMSGLSLLLIAVALVLIKGYSAGISELLIALGVLAIATYIARQAAIAEIGGEIGWYTLPVLLLGVAAAVFGAMARGDLGHAGVALALFCTFLLLFLRPVGMSLLLLSLLCGIGLLVDYPGNPASPLTHVVTGLEQVAPHAADRFLVLKDPFNHGPSDLARLGWLQAISGTEGWGVGYVPWPGLPGARTADGIPLQAPSDYIFTIAQAIWGWNGAWSLVAMAALVFLVTAWQGFRIALGDGNTFRRRFVGAIGALGCLAVLVKTILSFAGTLGLLPLTGVPIALLSYGTGAMWAGLAYVALVLTIPRDEVFQT